MQQAATSDNNVVTLYPLLHLPPFEFPSFNVVLKFKHAAKDVTFLALSKIAHGERGLMVVRIMTLAVGHFTCCC